MTRPGLRLHSLLAIAVVAMALVVAGCGGEQKPAAVGTATPMSSSVLGDLRLDTDGVADIDFSGEEADGYVSLRCRKGAACKPTSAVLRYRGRPRTGKDKFELPLRVGAEPGVDEYGQRTYTLNLSKADRKVMRVRSSKLTGDYDGDVTLGRLVVVLRSPGLKPTRQSFAAEARYVDTAP